MRVRNRDVNLLESERRTEKKRKVERERKRERMLENYFSRNLKDYLEKNL